MQKKLPLIRPLNKGDQCIHRPPPFS